MTQNEVSIDVSRLPPYAFGSRGVMWWGTLGMILIEGMMFAVLIGSYFYLRARVEHWPPGANPPRLIFGLINTVIILASILPNFWYKRAAEHFDLPRVRLWLLVSLGFAVAFIVVRVFEFAALNVHWRANAYGSVVWTLLGLHTTHLVTDSIDTVVLIALVFRDDVNGKGFVDVSENAFYWFFVVIAWLPIFAAIYLVPRWA